MSVETCVLPVTFLQAVSLFVSQALWSEWGYATPRPSSPPGCAEPAFHHFEFSHVRCSLTGRYLEGRWRAVGEGEGAKKAATYYHLITLRPVTASGRAHRPPGTSQASESFGDLVSLSRDPPGHAQVSRSATRAKELGQNPERTPQLCLPVTGRPSAQGRTGIARWPTFLWESSTDRPSRAPHGPRSVP